VSPTLVDLGYAGPLPPADLADRARRGGRRLRRRRRLGSAAAVLAVTAGAVLAAPALRDPGEPVVPAVPLPPAERNPVVTVTGPDDATVVVFLSADRKQLCYGPRVNAGIQDGRTGCMPRSDRRLSGTARFGSRGMDGFGLDGDQFYDAGEPQLVVFYGQVHGEVTRVRVAAFGTTVDATLARAADPAVGTLYAAAFPTTEVPTESPALVAYRGDRVTDRCGSDGRCLDDPAPGTSHVVRGTPVP
jgi:hypothetical protein